MIRQPAHKWEFLARFRAGAYGWNGSRLACQRLKEAVSELRSVSRRDPALAAEGSIRLMEKLWPSFERIDTSSGALGSATYHAVEALIDLCVAAPADVKTRARWLDRLWQAVEDDGVGYLQNVIDRWGDICGSPKVAGEWADSLLPTVRRLWSDRSSRGYFKGTTACLSSLLAAGRHEELLALLELAPFVWWDDRRFGVQALAKEGRLDEAIAYAQASNGLNTNPASIDAMCERLLLAAGRSEEAYDRYALSANRATTNLATFRSIQKKYPMMEPQTILKDLVAASPGEEGKWFATAKELRLFDLALRLVAASPCDPKTLNRAARDFVVKNPPFALGAALASLRWIASGYGYEITLADAQEACSYLQQAAGSLGQTDWAREEIFRTLRHDRCDPALLRLVERSLGAREGSREVRDAKAE